MKRTKTRKLVLTDGTWYYENTSGKHSFFTKEPKKAWNFYSECFPNINRKKDLQWELDVWTKHEPSIFDDKKAKEKEEAAKIDRNKFSLKWVTIIETIRVEDFNYEGFLE